METRQGEEEQDNLDELGKAELELMTEEELRETQKKPLPAWAWIFPIAFMFLGGLVSWIAFRKRRGAGWLFVVGIIMQGISALIIALAGS
jgi:hypothetical protein